MRSIIDEKVFPYIQDYYISFCFQQIQKTTELTIAAELYIEVNANDDMYHRFSVKCETE